jgi:hypothetical protein
MESLLGVVLGQFTSYLARSQSDHVNMSSQGTRDEHSVQFPWGICVQYPETFHKFYFHFLL